MNFKAVIFTVVLISMKNQEAKCQTKLSSQRIKEDSLFNRERFYLVFDGYSQDVIEKALANLKIGSLSRIRNQVKQTYVKKKLELRKLNSTKFYNRQQRLRTKYEDSRGGFHTSASVKSNEITASIASSVDDISSSSSSSSGARVEYWRRDNFTGGEQDSSAEDLFTNILKEDTGFGERHNALRFGSTCSKGARKACARACKSVLTNVCHDYKCSSSLKREFKKECSRNCKDKFD